MKELERKVVRKKIYMSGELVELARWQLVLDRLGCSLALVAPANAPPRFIILGSLIWTSSSASFGKSRVPTCLLFSI